MLALEKQKVKPDGWLEALTAPGARWRLIYTAPSKAVVAASKGQQGGAGGYFPIPACQKFDAEGFENGVFLGPVGSLTVKGPFKMNGRLLSFDVTNTYITLGPWRFTIPVKKEQAIEDMEPKAAKALPFFVYALVTEDIIVARGRSGGLALWARADSDWMAKAGVLQVYK